MELRSRYPRRLGSGAISFLPALQVGHGAQSRRRVQCALRPYRPHRPEPFRYLLDAAHGKMVAASHRRDACRGASDPRNGRYPASGLALSPQRAETVLDMTITDRSNERIPVLRVPGDRPPAERSRPPGPSGFVDTGADH